MNSRRLLDYASDPTRNGGLISGVSVVLVSGLVWVFVHFLPSERLEHAPGSGHLASATQTAPAVTPRTITDSASHVPVIERLRRLDTAGVVGGRQDTVGRAVRLRGTVIQEGNVRAFWLGERGNRVFVVIQPEMSHATADDWLERRPPLRRGEAIVVTGRVETVPATMDCEAWGLDASSHRELERAGVYVRAISVETERSPARTVRRASVVSQRIDAPAPSSGQAGFSRN